jgi:hypothetical protein
LTSDPLAVTLAGLESRRSAASIGAVDTSNATAGANCFHSIADIVPAANKSRRHFHSQPHASSSDREVVIFVEPRPTRPHCRHGHEEPRDEVSELDMRGTKSWIGDPRTALPFDRTLGIEDIAQRLDRNGADGCRPGHR